MSRYTDYDSSQKRWGTARVIVALHSFTCQSHVYRPVNESSHFTPGTAPGGWKKDLNWKLLLFPIQMFSQRRCVEVNK